MVDMKAVVIFLFSIFYFVTASPIVKKEEPIASIVKREVKETDPESQLHSLNQGSEDVVMIKSQSSSYSNINGQQQSDKHQQHQVLANDKVVESESKDEHSEQQPGQQPQSDIKITQDVPSENIHHQKTIHNGEIIEENKRQNSGRMTPMDLASYIMKTGDEEGVANAVETLIREKVISEEEAIRYLEEVKLDLRMLEEERQEMLELVNPISKKAASRLDEAMSFDEYQAQVDKLKMADLLYNEYTLEEMLYHISRIMFQQSAASGNSVALETIEKLANFLRDETKQGRITPQMQQKILDILMSSVMAASREEKVMAGQIKEGQKEVTEISPVDIP